MTGLREDPERDHRREIEAHLAERIDDLVEGGLSPDEAERAARAEFGDPNLALEEMGAIARRTGRRRRTARSLTAWWIDLVGVLRSLRRSPGHAAAVALTLALGIAATTTLFTAVDRVLLRPLPYGTPDRIATVWAVDPNGQATSPSLPDFQDWASESRSFEALAFVRGGMLTHLDPELGAARLGTAFVTSGFQEALRAPLAHGSLAAFSDPSLSEAVVALKHDAFLRRFGGDPSVVGEVLDFADGGRRLVAVLAPDVDYPLWADAFAPLTVSEAEDRGLMVRDYRLDNRALGRLADGVSLDAARAELEAMAGGLEEAYPETNRDWRATAQPLRDVLVGGQETSLWALFAAVTGLLGIAAANAASLAMARVLSRQEELGVRVSLGVTPGRLTRLVLMENTLLALVGGAAGVILSALAAPRFTAGLGGVVGAAGTSGPDGRVLLFALGVSLLAGGAAGALPALLASRRSLMARIRRTDGSRSAERARGAFVGMQVALTVALVATTALFARSLTTLQTAETGVETEGLAILRVTLPNAYQGDPVRRAALWARLVDFLEADPRVARAASVNHAPLTGTGVLTPGRMPGAEANEPVALWMRMVGEDFLPLVGLRITAGRGFGVEDHRSWSGGILVSETVARTLWEGRDPLGQRITVFRQIAGEADFGSPIEASVVGVVEDTRVTIPSDPTPAVYLPMEVHPWTSAYLTVRAAPGVSLQGPGLQALFRDAIRSADPSIPVDEVRAYDELASTSIQRDRFVASLSTTFSVIALLFATVGIYGGLAFMVRRRSRGLAIRVALGSSAFEASWSVLRPTLVVVAAGALAGVLLTAYLTRFLQSILVGVDPLDPRAFGGALAAVAAVSLVAAWLPARRAAKTDPVSVLRG